MPEKVSCSNMFELGTGFNMPPKIGRCQRIPEGVKYIPTFARGDTCQNMHEKGTCQTLPSGVRASTCLRKVTLSNMPDRGTFSKMLEYVTCPNMPEWNTYLTMLDGWVHA